MATQFIDEVRHAETFDRYLGKLGAPPSEVGSAVEMIGDFFARMENYAEALVCTQVLFEGLGVDFFQAEIETGPCPLLRAIFERVKHDEARHTAFGTLYLDLLVPRLTSGERRRLQERLDEGVRVFFAQAMAQAEAMPPLPVPYQARMAAVWQQVVPKALADVAERLRRWDLRLSAAIPA